jgi:hypothetical protein
MGMIGHQRPGIDAGFGINGQFSQTLDKVFAIGDIVDNPALFDSSHNDVMQGTRGIQAGATRHCSLPNKIFSNYIEQSVNLVNNVI